MKDKDLEEFKKKQDGYVVSILKDSPNYKLILTPIIDADLGYK